MTTLATILAFLDRFPGQWVDLDQLVRETDLDRQTAVVGLRELAANGSIRFNRNVSGTVFKAI